jgi:uncharacterized glyoxalase superfamily protein PhnB
MQVRTTTLGLTVADVPASARFFQRHFGYRQQMAAEGYVSLTRDDAAADLVFLAHGMDEQREAKAAGVLVAFTVDDLDAELTRLRDEGVTITLPLREEEWGERLFQVQDPNAVVVELVEWNEGTGPAAWAADI